jgi:assimilatory nitrate reductase catalytic subunit
VRGDPQHPANFGRLCTKGSTLHLTAAVEVTRQARLLQPMRRAARGEAPQPVSWDSALDQAAARFARWRASTARTRRAFYVSGQLLTEDYYVFNKLAKGLIGTNNVDTNSRLCMSSAVAGYKQTLGADAPPAATRTSTTPARSSSPAATWPGRTRCCSAGWRTRAARQPDQKLIVVDPRRTETAEAADLHLQILPGTDVGCSTACCTCCCGKAWSDRPSSRAHHRLRRAARPSCATARRPHRAEICGIREARHRAGRTLVRRPRADAVAVLPGPEPEQQRHRQERRADQPAPGHRPDRQARRRPLLADRPAQRDGRARGGRPGQPAVGAPRPGQPRAPRRGGRAVGPARRARHARPTAVEMFQAAADGEVKALWIVCTNPAQSLPDQATVQRALQRCPFVVLQEAFATTATARHADLLLPATTWGEKDGTVTNSERRISRVRAPCRRPGRRAHDWQIAVDVARRLERVGAAARPPRCSPTTAPSRSGTSTAPPPAAATWTSPA